MIQVIAQSFQSLDFFSWFVTKYLMWIKIVIISVGISDFDKIWFLNCLKLLLYSLPRIPKIKVFLLKNVAHLKTKKIIEFYIYINSLKEKLQL